MSEAGKQIIRSRTKSFRDIYVAPVTQNDATAYAAGTPVKLARAISGKVSDKFSVEKIYSDDGVEDTVETYEGTDVEFEVNSLAPQDKAMLFGHLYKNGWLVKNKDDKAPEVAVGYRAKKLNAEALQNCDGTASDMAATMQDNLLGRLTQLKSKLEDIGITVGNALLQTYNE